VIKLPYPVFDKRGTAKFDKAKKTLVLTLPVKPSEIVLVPISTESDCDSDGLDGTLIRAFVTVI
jgi:hypothetical protein